jgi:hypothetical protein
MKPAPTLADAAIRESLRNHRPYVPARIGRKIAEARKFVLDETASAFLADLSHASFVDGPMNQNAAIVDRTRVLARIPHAITWIEYDPREFRRRTLAAYGDKVNHVTPERTLDGRTIVRASKDLAKPEDIVPKMGWLMEQYGETFVVTLIVGGIKDFHPITLPCNFAWTTDTSVPSIPKSTPPDNPSDSRIATGIHGYDVPNVVIGTVPEMSFVSADAATRALAEWMGELRYIWALLAAINDVPVGIKHVKPSRGFVARGRYRNFVEHSVISIMIPKGRDPRVVANAAVIASRRRAHMVRGHWRRDWRHDGNKIWINEHQRGDSSLGFVLHDYKIKHEDERKDDATDRV